MSSKQDSTINGPDNLKSGDLQEESTIDPPEDLYSLPPSRNRALTALGMGLVGGKAPSLPSSREDVGTRGHSNSQSKLEMLAKSYSGGSEGDQGQGGREGVQNYLMKADSYRFLSRSSKNVTTGPMRNARPGRGRGREGGGGGRGGEIDVRTLSASESGSSSRQSADGTSSVGNPLHKQPASVPNSPQATIPPPASLAMPWRVACLFSASGNSVLMLAYAITGENWLLGWASILGTPSLAAMIIYFLSSLEKTDARNAIVGPKPAQLYCIISFKFSVFSKQTRPLVVLGLWFFNLQLCAAIGHLFTDSHGKQWVGWLAVSSIIWFNLVLFPVAGLLRKILCDMKPSEKPQYLATNLVKVGLSTLGPMLYLSFGALKCLKRADSHQNMWDQCSAEIYPQLAICWFLLTLLAFKILTPLSNMSIDVGDIINLNIPLHIFVVGMLAFLSFVLNIYLFAGIQQGEASDDIAFASVSSFVFALSSMGFHLIGIIFYGRTFFANPANSSPLPTSLPPTSLAKTWRLGETGTHFIRFKRIPNLHVPLLEAFIAASCPGPAFFITYALTGDSWHFVMGAAFAAPSAGSIVLYYFASLEIHKNVGNVKSNNKLLNFILARENRSLALFGIWLATIQISTAVPQISNGANGSSIIGWTVLSSIFWLNIPILYSFSHLHKIISGMSPCEIKIFLYEKIVKLGISSVSSMMYFSLDTFKCARKVTIGGRDTYDQCSGIFIPQFSICIVLLVVMLLKVIVAPLSTTSITRNDLIALNLPRQIILQGTLASLSVFLNIFLFVSMVSALLTLTLNICNSASSPLFRTERG